MSEEKTKGRYRVKYLGMLPEGDHRRMAFVMAKLFSIQPNEGLQKLKEAPFLLKENLDETKAEKFFKLLRSYGAVVSIEEENQRVLDRPQIFISRSRIHSSFLLLISFVLLSTFLIVGGEFLFSAGENESRLSFAKSEQRKAPQEVRNQNPEKGYLGAAASIIENMKSGLQKQGWKNYGANALEKEGGYLPKEDYEYAMRYIKAAEKKQGSTPEISTWKASLYALDGQKTKADEVFREAIRENPSNRELRNDYGGFLMDSEMYSKADFQFRALLQMDSTDAEAHKNLGTLHAFYLKDPARAKHHYSEYLKFGKKSDQERYLVAQELSQMVWTEKNGVQFPPKGEQFLGFEEFEKQRSELEILEQKRPEDLRLKEQKASLYGKRGYHDLAIEELNKVLKKDPKNSSAYYAKAQLQMAMEKPDQAYHTLKEAQKRGAVSAELYEGLGIMERYYKADTAETKKVVEQYLADGGRPNSLLRELLQK